VKKQTNKVDRPRLRQPPNQTWASRFSFSLLSLTPPALPVLSRPPRTRFKHGRRSLSRLVSSLSARPSHDASLNCSYPLSFLGSKLDLYSVLTLSSTATPAEIKSAYRRLALLHHPDKQASATPEQLEEANTKFQQIGFAYAVLKDEGRRRRYDESGRTDEGSGERARSEAEWKDYFRELWSGEVNAETLDEFQRNYQGALSPYPRQV
jgi:hypothetical protein